MGYVTGIDDVNLGPPNIFGEVADGGRDVMEGSVFRMKEKDVVLGEILKSKMNKYSSYSMEMRNPDNSRHPFFPESEGPACLDRA